MVADGERALGAGEPERAVELLDEALGLWRGAPLADLPYAPFAQAPVVRLEELRLAALELRIDAELALGRHRRLAGELQALVAEHPLRERLCGQLMLALYRDGRQADALAAYSAARTRLVEEIGIEPGPPLQELQRRILAQDPALAREESPPPAAGANDPRPPRRRRGDRRRWCRSPATSPPNAGHEVVAVALVATRAALAGATRRLSDARAAAAQRGSACARPRSRRRTRAATRPPDHRAGRRAAAPRRAGRPARDRAARGRPRRDHGAGGVRRRARRARRRQRPGGAVLVPFAGHEHDWAALELGAWLAAAHGAPLRLIGVEAGAGSGGSRREPPAGQRLAGAAARHGSRGRVGARPVGRRWRARRGTGGTGARGRPVRTLGARGPPRQARLTLARRAQPPALFVRRGLRPGGMAPPAALTRFTWSGVRG